MRLITPVILCGGGGTRLWPRSRVEKPKPFIPLIGRTTLFEETVQRCADPDVFDAPIVVTGARHLDHVEAQLAHVAGAQIVVEPSARNTAAAIALAALQMDADAIMLVCPSDHHIADKAAFMRAARAAADLASKDWLVSFGIDAKTPETGFGYLLQGDAIEGSPGFRVARFIEKPDAERAQSFLKIGGYSWNGGIFAFRAGTYLRELAQNRPALAALAQLASAHGKTDGHRFFPQAESFAKIASESVDYAVMEHTDRAAMVPVDMGWSDIGNWHALHKARVRDAANNAVSGKVELVDCRDVLVDTDGPRVSVIGLSDIVVVVDKNEVLITSASSAQLVGKLKGAAHQ